MKSDEPTIEGGWGHFTVEPQSNTTPEEPGMIKQFRLDCDALCELCRHDYPTDTDSGWNHVVYERDGWRYVPCKAGRLFTTWHLAHRSNK